MTAPTDPTAAADEMLHAVCWPPTPDPPHLPDWPVRAAFKDLLETAILHKVLCLLADRLARAGLDRGLPRAISRFLSGTLRANQYMTRLYRTEITRIMMAFGEAGLTAAALNGIAAESNLYGGTGARQFTDLDVLLAPDDITTARAVLAKLGYHSTSLGATAFTRHLDDILVSRITLDLSASTYHVADEQGVREILSRRCWQPLPGHDHPLPILSAPDALLHCLARLERTTLTGTPRWAICADALRLAQTCQNLPAPLVPCVAAAGWARLRHIWPQLAATPFPPGTKR